MRIDKLVTATALIAGTLSIANHGALADWSVGIGAEHFDWKETTTPAVEESGVRRVFTANWTQNNATGFLAAYRFKTYMGDVDYTGALLVSGVPVNSTTKYWGMSNEIQAIYRPADPIAEYVFGLGYDYWQRDLSPFQREDYDIVFLRLGVNINARTKQGFYGSFGLKLPIYTREDAHLETINADQNPQLRPGPDVSLYGELAYRFNPNWDLVGYYDSYRFKESDHVSVTSGGAPLATVWQPKSKMDVLGLKLQYGF